MFDVRRSSFKTTLYGINVTCECLQNNLALMGLPTAGLGPINSANSLSPSKSILRSQAANIGILFASFRDRRGGISRPVSL